MLDNTCSSAPQQIPVQRFAACLRGATKRFLASTEAQQVTLSETDLCLGSICVVQGQNLKALPTPCKRDLKGFDDLWQFSKQKPLLQHLACCSSLTWPAQLGRCSQLASNFSSSGRSKACDCSTEASIAGPEINRQGAAPTLLFS